MRFIHFELRMVLNFKLGVDILHFLVQLIKIIRLIWGVCKGIVLIWRRGLLVLLGFDRGFADIALPEQLLGSFWNTFFGRDSRSFWKITCIFRGGRFVLFFLELKRQIIFTHLSCEIWLLNLWHLNLWNLYSFQVSYPLLKLIVCSVDPLANIFEKEPIYSDLGFSVQIGNLPSGHNI